MTQPIGLYAVFSKNGAGVTGLGVSVNVHRITRSSGASTKIATAESATEIDDGLYCRIVEAADLLTYDYAAVFSTAGDVDDTEVWSIPTVSSDWLLNTVPGGYASGTAGHALGRIANGQLTIVQPVLDDGFFRIVPGRDYLAADGMAFTFSSTSWPTLADGTTIEFIFGDETLDGERTGDQTVRLEVTAEDGETLAAARSGRQHYAILATLPSGSVVGLAENAPCLVG